ncbi:MAG: hypothetical protein C0412_20010, partial [Flavobacterium sp.]|nr:hypothetical protein [Flavobacterium sp.]
YKDNLDEVADILISKGIYEFAKYDFDKAIRTFEKILEYKIDSKVKEIAEYRLGMIFRQKTDYENSKKYFCKNIGVDIDWPIDDKVIINVSPSVPIRFVTGLAITNYIEGRSKFGKLSEPLKLRDNTVYALWFRACKLFCVVLEKDPDNALALNGIVKLAFVWRMVQNLDQINSFYNTINEYLGNQNNSELSSYCQRYIDFLLVRNQTQEDIHIKANWYLCLGITANLYKTINPTETKSKYNDTTTYFDNAKKYAGFIETYDRIYSEDSEKLVDGDRFIEECDIWSNATIK